MMLAIKRWPTRSISLSSSKLYSALRTESLGSAVAPELSVGLIGNASGKNSDNEVELDPRHFR